MYLFAAAKQSNTLKLLVFLGIFQTKERVLRVNKSNIPGENTFNGYYFDIIGNHELSKDEKTFLLIFLQII